MSLAASLTLGGGASGGGEPGVVGQRRWVKMSGPFQQWLRNHNLILLNQQRYIAGWLADNQGVKVSAVNNRIAKLLNLKRGVE